MDTFKRVEIKYILTKEQYIKICSYIKQFMNYGKFGIYNICNIYFDTEDYKLIRTSLEKPVFKEKLRLRSYGIPKENDNVFFELKRKFKKIVYKRRSTMKYQVFFYFVNKKDKNQIEKELEYTMNLYNLKPKVFLSYDREEFISKEDSSFRLTFDSNIIARNYDVSFDYGIYGDFILDKDKYIMEVKVSNNMPLWFIEILEKEHIYPSSFSKYGQFYKNKILKENFS